MEKQNMYPDMPQLPGGMPDAPPSYNQAYATAPATDMPQMQQMGSSGPTPMPPQQQQPQFVQQQPTVIYQEPAAAIPPLGPRPCIVTCPSCHQRKVSNVVLETSTKTHLFALLLCVVGCFCCACIPYCVDTCKNPNHYCANCNAYLGTYNK